MLEASASQKRKLYSFHEEVERFSEDADSVLEKLSSVDRTRARIINKRCPHDLDGPESYVYDDCYETYVWENFFVEKKVRSRLGSHHPTVRTSLRSQES